MVVAVVVLGHVAVLALLAIRQERDTGQPIDDRILLTFFDPPEAAMPESPTTPSPRPTRRFLVNPPPSVPAPPAPDAPTAISPGVDWYAHGANAAQRAAAEPTTRSFGFPKREPPPREKKAFGWDKTHTDRVHALDGGGLGIHLSDNCELVIAPFPMAGCALGKRKARGDLFDEMKAPVEPGDWKDR